MDHRTVARIVQARGTAAGFNPVSRGSHSLKRGALNTPRTSQVHPPQLEQLGRHTSYEPLVTYIQDGDLFGDNCAEWRRRTLVPSLHHTRHSAVPCLSPDA